MFSEGGGDALQAPLQSLAINTVALLVLSVLFFRDFQSRKKELEKIEREGKLSKLQVVFFVVRQKCEMLLDGCDRCRGKPEKPFRCIT